MSLKFIILIIGFVSFFSLVIWLVIFMLQSATKFYNDADSLEKDVIQSGTTQEEYEKLHGRLIKLARKSFHSRTTSRIREIAKMMEIKFDVKILKQ